MHERIVDLRVAAEGRRRLSVSAAVALALGGLGTLAIATFSTPLAGVCAADDPPPPGGAPAAPAPAPAAPAKVRFPNDKERAELVPLFRSYLEGDSPDGFKFRIAMLGALKKLEASGVGILADIEKLKGLIYQARPFLPGYEKKNVPKEIAKETEVIFNSGTGVTNVKWGESRLSISLPPAYVAARDAKKLGTLPPFPMIVTLHTKDDYEDAKQQKPWAGEEAIKRLYPKTSMKAVTDAWIVYAPIYPKGKFTDDDAVRRDRVPLPPIFRRHHVDFDRIVIEGGIEAVLFAAAYPMYFAGVIVHGDTTDVPADLVQNLASTSVFVMQTGDAVAPIVKKLTDGGHPPERLRSGPPSALPEWLGTVRRTVPKAFKWAVKDKSAHRTAYWINIDVLDESVPVPTIEAGLVDTPEAPNTVRITSTGVRGITLFLNDELIDLDREVRVVINGKPLDECRIESNRPEGTAVRLPSTFARTLDGMFDRNMLSIRKTQIYGWLFPVVLEQIAIPGDAPGRGPSRRRHRRQQREGTTGEGSEGLLREGHRTGEGRRTAARTHPLREGIRGRRDDLQGARRGEDGRARREVQERASEDRVADAEFEVARAARP